MLYYSFSFPFSSFVELKYCNFVPKSFLNEYTEKKSIGVAKRSNSSIKESLRTRFDSPAVQAWLDLDHHLQMRPFLSHCCSVPEVKGTQIHLVSSNPLALGCPTHQKPIESLRKSIAGAQPSTFSLVQVTTERPGNP